MSELLKETNEQHDEIATEAYERFNEIIDAAREQYYENQDEIYYKIINVTYEHSLSCRSLPGMVVS